MGKGKITTGGQERSTARRGHNREQAAGCLGFRGLLGNGAATGGGDHLFSPEDVRLAKGTGRAGPIGWCVVGTNGFLNNVWVRRVRGDSRHCENMSVEQHLCWLAAPTLTDSTEVDNNHIFALLKIMNASYLVYETWMIIFLSSCVELYEG